MQHPGVAALLCTATAMLSLKSNTGRRASYSQLDSGNHSLQVKGLYRPGFRAHRTVERLRQYGTRVGFSALPCNVDCSICQEPIHEPIVTPCHHIYCKGCISRWLGRSAQCPDCRQDLTVVKPSIQTSNASSTRYSSSHWVIDSHAQSVISDKSSREGIGPDPEDLSRRLLEVLKHSPQLEKGPSPDQRIPLTVRKASRTWCMQRRTPLRNRAAHPLTHLELDPATPRAQSSLSYRMDTPLSPLSFTSQKMSRVPLGKDYSPASKKSPFDCKARSVARDATSSPSPVRTPKASASTPKVEEYKPTPPPKSKHRNLRSISLMLPRLNSHHKPQPYQFHNHHIGPTFTGITMINSHVMLSHMHYTSQNLASNPDIPYRCKAAAKCIWREWREFILSNEGGHLYTDALLEALLKIFEKTIVEYGWAADWRELPGVFVESIESASREVVFGASVSKYSGKI